MSKQSSMIDSLQKTKKRKSKHKSSEKRKNLSGSKDYARSNKGCLTVRNRVDNVLSQEKGHFADLTEESEISVSDDSNPSDESNERNTKLGQKSM